MNDVYSSFNQGAYDPGKRLHPVAARAIRAAAAKKRQAIEARGKSWTQADWAAIYAEIRKVEAK